MSSITFPDASSSHHLHGHEDQFYQPSFDTSSFQMNPLSAHPPRTPRTSLIHNHEHEHNYHASLTESPSSTTTTHNHTNGTSHSHKRTQSTSSQHHFSSSIYEERNEFEEKDISEVGDEIEVDTELGEEGGDAEGRNKERPRVRQEEVWRDMIVTSNGRDKAFKLIQYSIRLGLWFHTSLTSTRLLRRPTRPPWERDIVRRLTSTAAGLSLTRKLLLLFNWLHPLSQILAQQASKPFLHTLLYAPPPVLLELANAIADDLATWSKLGLLGAKFGERAGRFADWCWFLATIVGLVENGVERGVVGGLQAEVEGRLYTESMSGATAKSRPKASKIDEKELARLRKQDYWLQVTRAKLVMDLIFVSYEVFRFKRGKDFVKASTGLASAILSSSKLYDRHKNTLLKTLLNASS
ncbi:unnamed protein product [Cyclocybe aegerita]|uniref:Uncharacterized protein n=1 Tax=Cyclocybe aegerita TaxID=1973307 RepID=A0A8S0VWM8_CYCAE|nr:unnamed protein product [Cyclocybe aegerita]